jgi:hypothetical protein
MNFVDDLMFPFVFRCEGGGECEFEFIVTKASRCD